MKKFIIQSVAILLVLFGALAYSTGKLPDLNFTNITKLTEVKVKDTKIKVEVADSADERRKGLGERESLASDSGMLFRFPKPDYYNFWMKNMKFGIDIIWIADGKIVDISKSVLPQAAGQSDKELPIYTPIQPVTEVLEVTAGFSDAHQIQIGDRIEISK